MSKTPVVTNNDTDSSPELLERLRRVGEACRATRNEAQRHDAPVVAQALLVWEKEE